MDDISTPALRERLRQKKNNDCGMRKQALGRSQEQFPGFAEAVGCPDWAVFDALRAAAPADSPRSRSQSARL